MGKILAYIIIIGIAWFYGYEEGNFIYLWFLGYIIGVLITLPLIIYIIHMTILLFLLLFDRKKAIKELDDLIKDIKL